MSWVNEQYDIVIIDTPPVLAVTDAALVARAAGTTLMVARFDKTSVKEMENTVKRLQHVGVKVSGTILNDIIKSAALYYSSGYSQYEYGYASRKKGKGVSAGKTIPLPGGRGVSITSPSLPARYAQPETAGFLRPPASRLGSAGSASGR